MKFKLFAPFFPLFFSIFIFQLVYNIYQSLDYHNSLTQQQQKKAQAYRREQKKKIH